MKIDCFKINVLVVLSVLLIILNNFAFAMDYNYDIQKVTLDYYYYEGFWEDKVVQSVKDESWHILKPDGSLINLKGDYLAYAGMEGKNLNFDDDYYRFVIGNDSYQIDNSTRFIYVDKNGLECFVEGYTYVDPTKGENYFILRNIKGNGYETGLYHKYERKVVIPTLYDTLNYINDDRIVSCKNDRYGLINIRQEEIIPFEYEYIDYINDNFIIAVKDEKYGVININNEMIHSFEYDEISNINELNDYFKISNNNKFGLVNTYNAEIVIPPKYDDIEYAGNGLVVALQDGQKGVIDVNFKEIVPFIYDSIMCHDDGFIVFKDELAGFLNKQGKIILPVEYFNILEIKIGFITAVINDENNEYKYAVYDLNGEEIVPPIYDNIDYYATDKYMIAKKGWHAYFIDKLSGEEILVNLDLPFSDVKYINDKYYAGGSWGNYAVANFAGQRLTLESYNDISIINVNGEDLIAAKYRTGDRFNIKFDYFKQTKGPSTWAAEEVSKAIENNLVPFQYQSAFTVNIKRYEFCSIMVEFLEQYYNTTKEDIIENNKIDVINPPITDGFSDDVVICFNLGIVNGRGNGIFDSDSEITREEAAVMLTNLAKYLEQYTGANEVYLNDKSEISEWAKDAAKFVLQNRIMQGTGNNTFSPKSKLTREQTYIIMYRMLNDTMIAQDNDVKLLANKLTDGNYEGFTARTKDKSQIFSSWVNVDNPTYAPTTSIADVDGDGKDEIVIILTTGYGTGIHDEKIHILNLEDLTELNIENPFEAINNRVSSSIIINGDKADIIIKWNGNTFEKRFDKSYSGWWFDKIAFRNVIYYEIENDRIIAKVSGQMSPAGFPVKAILEYDENLKVINIEMEDTELDKYLDK